jgi:hypothetical protein
MRFFGTMVVIIGIMTSLAGAEGFKDTANDKKVVLSGMVELEASEMVKARITFSSQRNSTVDHVWGNNLLGTLKFSAEPAPYLNIRGSFEFRQYTYKTTFSSTYNLGDFIYTDFFIREGQGVFSLFNGKSLSVDMAIGLMPYKYNREARGLGEFLFKSGTYPFYLYTDFDRQFARLTGMRASVKYDYDFLGVKLDLLALTERETRPFWDLSFAAIGDITLFKMLDIGGGVDFAHAVAMDKGVTEPRNQSTEYYYNYNADSTGSDTGYYTFAGTKVMARGTIDPFGMVRHDDGSILRSITGENGGKIYGEIAIIGLENYPANISKNPYGYDKLEEKMPWMVGFNSPTHPFITYGLYPELAVILFKYTSFHRFLFGEEMKRSHVSLKWPSQKDSLVISDHLVFGLFPAVVSIGGWALDKYLGSNMNWIKKISLDEVSFELEHYPNRNPNSAAYVIREGFPLPYFTNLGGEYDTSQATGSTAYKPRWYWTLYMKKQIIKNFSIVCQIGRDHQRWEMPMNYQTSNYDYEEALVKYNDWGWRIKTIFNF